MTGRKKTTAEEALWKDLELWQKKATDGLTPAAGIAVNVRQVTKAINKAKTVFQEIRDKVLGELDTFTRRQTVDQEALKAYFEEW